MESRLKYKIYTDSELRGYSISHNKLTDKELERLVSGNPKNYLIKCWQSLIIPTIILSLIVVALVNVFVELIFTESHSTYDWMSPILTLAFSALPLIIIGCIDPNVKEFFYGQFTAKELSIRTVNRGVLIACLVSVSCFIASTLIICFLIPLINNKIACLLLRICFLLIFSSSLDMLVFVRKIKSMAPLKGCEGCGMVNTYFYVNSSSVQYGAEEERLKSTKTGSHTIGTLHDASGHKIGTVTSSSTTYTYEIGRNYSYKDYMRCACCGHEKYLDRWGFHVDGTKTI